MCWRRAYTLVKLASRHRKPVMVAEGIARYPVRNSPALLQERNNFFDEDFEHAWQYRRHKIKPVRCTGLKPVDHQCHHPLWCAGEGRVPVRPQAWRVVGAELVVLVVPG